MSTNMGARRYFVLRMDHVLEHKMREFGVCGRGQLSPQKLLDVAILILNAIGEDLEQVHLLRGNRDLTYVRRSKFLEAATEFYENKEAYGIFFRSRRHEDVNSFSFKREEDSGSNASLFRFSIAPQTTDDLPADSELSRVLPIVFSELENAYGFCNSPELPMSPYSYQLGGIALIDEDADKVLCETIVEELFWYCRLARPLHVASQGLFRSVYRVNFLSVKHVENLARSFEIPNLPTLGKTIDSRLKTWLEHRPDRRAPLLPGTLTQIGDACFVWRVPEKERERAFNRLFQFRVTLYRNFVAT